MGSALTRQAAVSTEGYIQLAEKNATGKSPCVLATEGGTLKLEDSRIF